MAGVGFLLRKLTQRDNLLGIFQGYFYSTFIATGPWLLTIMCLGAIHLVSGNFTSFDNLIQFRLIVIYNFGFSLVFCGPLVLVTTRFLGDRIFAKEIKGAANMLLGAMSVIAITQLPLVGWYYGWFVDPNGETIDSGVRIAAFFNYFIIAILWQVMVFLTTIKAYRLITWTFFFGMALGLYLTMTFARFDSVAGMLLGFDIGLLVIVATLVAYIMSEYPASYRGYFTFMKYFRKYWEIALGGLAYNMAIWADKWIMWTAPEREEIIPGMPSYPDYDSAMFLAFLTIVPALTMFLVHLETGFYEKYLNFYRAISRHAHYKGIMENHKSMVVTLMEGARTILVIQGAFSLVMILIAPRIFDLLDLSFTQVSIFRFGVFGAVFHSFIALAMIVLFYFDFRREVMILSGVFLGLNLICSYVTMNMGFAYYGYGYFLSALLAFVITFLVTAHRVRIVPFQTFVLNNKSVL